MKCGSWPTPQLVFSCATGVHSGTTLGVKDCRTELQPQFYAKMTKQLFVHSAHQWYKNSGGHARSLEVVPSTSV